MVLYSDNEEAVEWVNMCWRKVRDHWIIADNSTYSCLYDSGAGALLELELSHALLDRCGGCIRGGWSGG